MRPHLLMLGFAVALAGPAAAQIKLPGGAGFKPKAFADVGEIAAEVIPAKAKAGEVVTLKLTITPKRGWHTYPVNAPEAQTGRISLKPEAGAKPQVRTLYVVGPVKDPDGWEDEPSTDRPFQKDRVYKKAATWELKAVVSPNEKPGLHPVTFDGFSIQVCESECQRARADDYPKLTFEVLPGPPAAVPADYRAELAALTEGAAAPPPSPAVKETAPGGIVKKKHIPLDEYQAKLDALLLNWEREDSPRESGLASLLLAAGFWGFISLATPCVFPMIPITVSLFLKQSNQSTRGAVKLAGVYCGTIIAVLGLSAFSLLGLFRLLSVHPLMNLLLGALFIALALSLLGMYNLTLPNFLLRAAESKRKRGGLLGTVFGAIAFSIVSFTCVAPFLGDSPRSPPPGITTSSNGCSRHSRFPVASPSPSSCSRCSRVS